MIKLSRTESHTDVDNARERWLKASDGASKLASELFQMGSGYGCPDARAADEHRLETARIEAERLFREYIDLDRRVTDGKIYALQRSQTFASWASFTVAFVVGAATIVNIVLALGK